MLPLSCTRALRTGSGSPMTASLTANFKKRRAKAGSDLKAVDSGPLIQRVPPMREIVIVLYHHIAECNDRLTNQLAVSTKPDVFEKHVRYFAKNFDLVSATDLLSGSLPRRALLVTFDDAYRSVLEIGAPILSTVKAPSLFFINPATVASSTLPIDNVLSFGVEELGLTKVLSLLKAEHSKISSTGQLIATIISSMTKTEIVEAKHRIFSAVGVSEAAIRSASGLFLGPADIKALGPARVEVGNHSMNHLFLRSLSVHELKEEIAESRDVLERLSGQTIKNFSVPYGNRQDATDQVLNIARSSGHKAIFLVHAKSNRFRPSKDIYYRISLGNTSPERVPLELLAMPILRSFRDLVQGTDHG
jgi:peptidoglycan/xylan/chitin deacetylase (PgdA/CDA1 family)